MEKNILNAYKRKGYTLVNVLIALLFIMFLSAMAFKVIVRNNIKNNKDILVSSLEVTRSKEGLYLYANEFYKANKDKIIELKALAKPSRTIAIGDGCYIEYNKNTGTFKAFNSEVYIMLTENEEKADFKIFSYRW